MDQLASASAFDDTIRITIPRACRFAYDIASNRGARHDPSEVNPNVMDANGVVAVTSWALGELVRYAQKGAMNLDEIQRLVDGLAEKKYPLIEEVDGRTYFHVPGASARGVALLQLWKCHPGRMNKRDIEAAVRRHGFSSDNAKMAVARLADVVDADDNGGLRLLQPGVREGDVLLARAQVGSAGDGGSATSGRR